MKEALIGLAGVVLGLAASAWTTVWTDRQRRRDIEYDRLNARQEEASKEIRKALISIHHLKHTLEEERGHSGPEALLQLVHTIDTYTLVLASEELRGRLTGATQIMWYWHTLSTRQGHPVWVAVDDATECIGTYLRAEPLPEEPSAVTALRLEAEQRDYITGFERGEIL